MAVVTGSALAVSILMVATWGESLRRHDASIVDIVWGPAFVLVALVAADIGDGNAGSWLLLGMTSAWGLRLAGHLIARKRREPGEDRRYAAFRQRRASRFGLWSLCFVFALQGALVLVVSAPLIAAASCDGDLGVATALGLAAFSSGLAFEAVGDAQLSAFKRDPDNASGVMDWGLWRYTRHPNYFGDSCVWWGIWLVAVSVGAPWWAVASPIVMSFLLIRVSGKRLLERDIGERRPGYAEYVHRTSGFFPLPPRGSAGG